MSERKERCETCKWWKCTVDQAIEEGEDMHGTCRRYPPSLSDALLLLCSMSVAGPPIVSGTFANTDTTTAWENGQRTVYEYASHYVFPLTLQSDWCGEWEPNA